MLQAHTAIERLKNGEMKVLKDDIWLRFLALTKEQSVNLEHLFSLDNTNQNFVLSYVEKTLTYLNKCQVNEHLKTLLEETLKWSEVAKTGLPHQRKIWIHKGYNLFAHNIGSAQIYLEAGQETDPNRKEIIHTLIQTHGLLGQTIRGEVPLDCQTPLYTLVFKGLLSQDELKELLCSLNFCVISAVDEAIWQRIQNEAAKLIDSICQNRFSSDALDMKERLRRLRAVAIQNGEDFEAEYQRVLVKASQVEHLKKLLQQTSLWYVEAALFDFSFEEFIKIFMMLGAKLGDNVHHISFERLMKEIYYQHEGKKRVNIYKKRIIEKYLSSLSFDAILKGEYAENIHVVHEITTHDGIEDTVFFTFHFSPAGLSLIDFCTEAEKSDLLYEKAIVLLFDLFGLRKDAFDRFYQEENYLNTMNQAIDYKKIILDYIKGKRVVDIGPGGGALMDLICERFSDKQVLGVDISQNVLDALRKKKQMENRKWDVVYGDALNLSDAFKEGSVDTIIFCSVLHELFSYIDYQGAKFNHDTLKAALKSAFNILPSGGRIIIRDGIMTEPQNQTRIIRFLSEEGMGFLKRYTEDFKGREIQYDLVGQNEVKMPVNDAMEFLYTYTWGEKSYVHEVQEQFGYLTPTGFREMISELFGDSGRIIELKHFLQEGYTLALSQKVAFFDGDRKPINLPDSTCLVVIEKV